MKRARCHPPQQAHVKKSPLQTSTTSSDVCAKPSIRERCFASRSIFDRMYPTITYTIGNAPAPANVAAFAAAGWWYVILATVLCGVVIGAISFLARGRTPLSAATCVAACVYAYYVCQTSFVGSLVDSYGLFWLLMPLAVCAAAAHITRAITPNR